MNAKHWSVEVYISADGDETVARAVLFAGGSTRLTGMGTARRNPIDRPVPEIGDELAAGRALADLADRLSTVAADDIAQLTGPA